MEKKQSTSTRFEEVIGEMQPEAAMYNDLIMLKIQIKIVCDYL